MASLRRFAPEDISKLKLMADCGHTGKSIAKALDRAPQAVRVKCCELGIKLKRQSVASRRVRLPAPVWAALKVAADAHGMTVVKFNALLIETIVRDRLFNAVLDTPPPKRTAMAAKAKAEAEDHPRPPAAPPPNLVVLSFAPQLLGRAA